MSLLGIPFLLMGETENRIAENERFSLQALYAAESGAKLAVRWFDRPADVTTMSNPALAVIDRSLRLIDLDGDPATPGVLADGTPGKPRYKQSLDDVFQKPYRGGLEDALMGTEDGPDIRIDGLDRSASAAMVYLDDLSDDLFGVYPGSSLQARIARIDIYGPPTVKKGVEWIRYGVGTIKVIGRVYQDRPDGTMRVVGERMVKVVINEVPYNPGGTLGALHSCGEVDWSTDFTVHWGRVSAAAVADLASDEAKLPASLPRVVPPSPAVDLLWGHDNDVNWDAFYTAVLETNLTEIRDPWVRFHMFDLGDEVDPSPAEQWWAFTGWTPGNPLGEFHLPYNPKDAYPEPGSPEIDWIGGHSNFIKKYPDCPQFPYQVWKEIAKRGTGNAHYYVWDNTDKFRKNGTGSLEKFRVITDTNTGLFFFDTKDGNPPDGTNLTPAIVVADWTWQSKGLIYLNAESIKFENTAGRDTTFRAPGEPFQDKNENGRWDTGERWLKLQYPTQLVPASDGPEGHFYAAAKIPGDERQVRGPEIVDLSNMEGVFYNSGEYKAGNGRFYGSFIANGIDDEGSSTPDHYFNEDLRTSWPPSEWAMPRVVVTRWETDL